MPVGSCSCVGVPMTPLGPWLYQYVPDPPTAMAPTLSPAVGTTATMRKAGLAARTTSLKSPGGFGPHLPLVQVAALAQALASRHGVPAPASMVRHPALGSQTSVVQTSLSSQETTPPPLQMALAQTSPLVQASPSSQALVLPA